VTAAHADAAKLLAENVRLVEALKVARESFFDVLKNWRGLRDFETDSTLRLSAECITEALAASPQSVAASEVIEAAERLGNAKEAMPGLRFRQWLPVVREYEAAWNDFFAAVDRLRKVREGK
jgi:hypothetical protein